MEKARKSAPIKEGARLTEKGARLIKEGLHFVKGSPCGKGAKKRTN